MIHQNEETVKGLEKQLEILNHNVSVCNYANILKYRDNIDNINKAIKILKRAKKPLSKQDLANKHELKFLFRTYKKIHHTSIFHIKNKVKFNK